MNITRRSFVGGVSGLAGVVLLPTRSFAVSESDNPELIPKELMFSVVNRAMDAANSAGADHVEVSLSRSLWQNFDQPGVDVESLKVTDTAIVDVGVRVMINGRWGHASSNQFEGDDELIRIAKAACSQARANSKKKPRHMDWVAAPTLVANYVSPGIDPIAITQEEKIDFINSWVASVQDYKSPNYTPKVGRCILTNTRTERAFVNSSGSNLYSITYLLACTLPLVASMKNSRPMTQPQTHLCRGLMSQQAGWDVIRESRPHDQIPELIEKSALGSMISGAPVDIGRYDVVCSAATSAGIIAQSIVAASEIDRAIGLEANADGTSYLGPDLMMHLGSEVGNEHVNLSVNRTLERGLATIPWDAEGVPAKTFELVRKGKLVDYFTNRELSPLLNEWYSKNGVSMGSNGCSTASSSSDFPVVGPANIRMEPGKEDVDEDELISEVKEGYLLMNVPTATSFQRQDGFMAGLGRKIVNGKLRDYVQLGALFNTTNLLKSVTGIGGKRSHSVIPLRVFKGQPVQELSYSVESVPLRFSNVAIIDPKRKI